MHAYGIGAAKTGTTSLASIFATHFRAVHEPATGELLDMFEREEAGRATRDDIVAYLRQRDRILNLEMDSSALNRRYARLTAELFPEAKFILTVRDPFSRTDSLINHLVNNPPVGRARERADVVFRAAKYRHSPEERLLEEHGLHTLDGMLEDYAETTYGVVEAIPEDRLLVVRTDRIRQSLAEMAGFLGIREDLLDSGKSHTFKAKKKHGLLLRLDPEFVDEKVHRHCGRMLAQFFPEIRSIADVSERLHSD